MNRILSFFFLLVFYTSTSYCQTIEPQWGTSNSIDGSWKTAEFGPLDLTDDHYYTYAFDEKSGIKIMKYNFDHQLMETKKEGLDIPGEVSLMRKSILRMQSGDFLLFGAYQKKKKENSIYFAKCTDGQLGKLQPLLSHAFVGDKESKPYYHAIISQSIDQSKLAYINQTSTNESKADKEMVLALMDSELNVVWEKNQKFPYSSSILHYKDMEVSNDGTIFILMEYYKPNLRRAKNVIKFDYKLFAVTKSGMEEYDIKLDKGLLPISAELFINKNQNNTVQIAGLFTKNKVKSMITGLFSTKIDDSGLSAMEVHEFSTSDGKLALGDEYDGKALALDLNELITGSFTLDDGSFGFTTERMRFHIPMDRVAYPVLITGRLFTFILNPDGTLKSIAGISKDFHNNLIEECSYNFTVYQDKLYFVFNDFKKTKADKAKRKKSKGKSTAKNTKFTELVVINASGEQEYRDVIFTNKTVGKEFRPNLCLAKDHNFLLGIADKKQYQMGLLDLNQLGAQ